MDYQILAKPSYAALKCLLQPGESLRTESGAMLAMDESARIKGTMEGGAWKALKRTILTSESFFVTTIEATKSDTEVYLAPRATGDVEQIALESETYLVQGGSFLACDSTVDTDTHFSGWKGFVSGEGIFMIKTSGTGSLFVSSFGGILKRELAAGETFVVDNGHLVAFPASMKYRIQNPSDSIWNMVSTGEGLVTVLEGPGTVYLQTRNLRTFAEELNPFLRARERGQGRGLLGNIFGG